MKYRHFLLTRYALWFDRLLEPDWFEHRLKLFVETLDSVHNQLARDFVWLLFYSPIYEPQLRSLFHLVGSTPWIRTIPVYRGNFEQCDAEMRAAMSALMTDEEWVLSTRLDNDDLIAPMFVQRIQEGTPRTPERHFVNFDYGVNRSADSTREHFHPSNMFQTCVEPREGFKGIFSWAHNSTRHGGQIFHISDKLAWIHVMHDKNAWPEGRPWDGEGKAEMVRDKKV